MKDALGNKIQVGSWYGYSRIANGIVDVVVGKVEKLTEKKVTLTECVRQWGAHGNPDIVKPGKNVSVYARTLFPVDREQFNKELS